jgi:O-antigen/teichoic acid export membrane protein
MIPGIKEIMPVFVFFRHQSNNNLVLILLVILTALYQQNQITKKTGKSDNPQAQQMQMVGKVMPIFFGFISWTLPTGLVVYFLTGNIFRIGQQALIVKLDDKETNKKEENKKDVLNTAAISIIITSILFASLFSIFKLNISEFTGISTGYLSIVVWILVVDALTVIPFAYLRLKGSAFKYSTVKIINVLVYFSLNIFFLIFLKDLAGTNDFLNSIYIKNYEVAYIFIANLIASIISLLLLIPFYFEIEYKANLKLLKKMLAYGFPILISGLAFTINETFDKILLDFLLPAAIAKTQIGMYSACYKLAIFMTLFSTAYKLAIEPFFFSEADKKNSSKSYALVLETFVIIGSSILVLVVVSLDILKVIFIGDPEYWQADRTSVV